MGFAAYSAHKNLSKQEIQLYIISHMSCLI